MKRKSIIISISGTKLTKKEITLIKNEKPWGVILFKRNIISHTQCKKLTHHIRKTIKDKNYPILIDEEGGTVSRLSRILDNSIYSQNFFGKLFEQNKSIGIKIYQHYIYIISTILKDLGFNINTIPVLDILKKNTSKIIGERSFSENINTIKLLGNICISTYRKEKIGTVIKHIPGHGSAKTDSHKVLPLINDRYSYLIRNDFKCFKSSKSFFAMTAHVLFKKVDDKNVVTHSKFIIDSIIRKKLGFKGILISDDISMKSLKYDILKNAQFSLTSGCNLVLYCAGKVNESEQLLKHMPLIDSFTAKKTSEFYKFLS